MAVENLGRLCALVLAGRRRAFDVERCVNRFNDFAAIGLHATAKVLDDLTAWVY